MERKSMAEEAEGAPSLTSAAFRLPLVTPLKDDGEDEAEAAMRKTVAATRA